MSDTGRERDEFVEDGGLELDGEEFGVVREERGIQITLDGREVKGVVFEAGMISHDEEGDDGEQEYEREIWERPIAGEGIDRRFFWR